MSVNVRNFISIQYCIPPTRNNKLRFGLGVYHVLLNGIHAAPDPDNRHRHDDDDGMPNGLHYITIALPSCLRRTALLLLLLSSLRERKPFTRWNYILCTVCARDVWCVCRRLRRSARVLQNTIRISKCPFNDFASLNINSKRTVSYQIIIYASFVIVTILKITFIYDRKLISTDFIIISVNIMSAIWMYYTRVSDRNIEIATVTMFGTKYSNFYWRG